MHHTTHRIASALAVFIFALNFATLTGCSTQSSVLSPSGIKVSASSDTGQVTLSIENDSASVKIAGVTVLVGKTVSVDGQYSCAVPAGSRAVDLKVDNGTLTVFADGKQIHQESLK